MRDRPYLKLATAPEMNIICFRGQPEYLASEGWDNWNKALCKQILEKAQIFLSLPLYQNQRWLKAVLLNPFTRKEQISGLFQAIDEFYNSWAKVDSSLGES